MKKAYNFWCDKITNTSTLYVKLHSSIILSVRKNHGQSFLLRFNEGSRFKSEYVKLGVQALNSQQNGGAQPTIAIKTITTQNQETQTNNSQIVFKNKQELYEQALDDTISKLTNSSNVEENTIITANRGKRVAKQREIGFELEFQNSNNELSDSFKLFIQKLTLFENEIHKYDINFFKIKIKSLEDKNKTTKSKDKYDKKLEKNRQKVQEFAMRLQSEMAMIMMSGNFPPMLKTFFEA